VTFPCDGVRVLDLASGQAALVGMVLADYGADVVRIEPPVRRPLDDVPRTASGTGGRGSTNSTCAPQSNERHSIRSPATATW